MSKLQGYIKSDGRLTDWHGKDLGWSVEREVTKYRNEMGDKSAAVILTKQTKTDAKSGKVQVAVGYMLIDNGELFRGEVYGAIKEDLFDHALPDYISGAKSESEYWFQRDEEDRVEFEREQEKEDAGLEERGTPANESHVRELVLYIDNDGDLYRSMTTPIMKNLAKKMLKGTYNHDLAVKGWTHLANAGAQKYTKEYDGPGGQHGSYGAFSPADRKAAAVELADAFEREMEAQGQAGIEHLAKGR